MAQILRSYPTVGEKFATGLGSGLELLAQQKLQDFARQAEQKRGIQGLQALGYSTEEAHGIAQLPQALQQVAVKEKFKSAQMAPLMEQLQGLYGLGEQPTAPSGVIGEPGGFTACSNTF